jgi:hypothetical protein
MVDLSRIFQALRLAESSLPYRAPKDELRRIDMAMAYVNGARDGIAACGCQMPEALHQTHANLQSLAEKTLAQIELHK